MGGSDTKYTLHCVRGIDQQRQYCKEENLKISLDLINLAIKTVSGCAFFLQAYFCMWFHASIMCHWQKLV